jgi:hypothetical protein
MLIHKNYFTRAVFLLLLLELVACDATNEKETGAMNTINLPDWEQKMHVIFPEKTEALGLKVDPGMDEVAYLKVSIPKHSWKGFIENSLFQLDDMDNAKRFFLGTDNDWWDPSKPLELPAAQAALPDGSIVNIGLDLSKESKAIIYLMWHEQ